MELRFPNARLLVYDRILGGSVGCASALVSTAYDTGILARGSMDAWLEDFEQGGFAFTTNCAAKIAARKILEESLRQSGVSEEDLAKLTASVYANIEKELQTYLASRETANDCEDLRASKESGQEKELCVDYAPLVLDLLLQQHMKH